MTKFARLAALASATAIAATPAVAAPTASTPVAKARVAITKPLTLTSDRDLDFGSVAVTGAGTVIVNQLGTTRSCGAAIDLVCTGTFSAARFHVTGSNQQTVTISAGSPTTLTRVGFANTIPFRPLAPASVALPNSGAAGIDFTVGGEIDLLASTPEGTYQGDIVLTVDY